MAIDRDYEDLRGDDRIVLFAVPLIFVFSISVSGTGGRIFSS